MELENDYTVALGQQDKSELDQEFFGDEPLEEYGLKPSVTPNATFEDPEFEPSEEVVLPEESTASKVGKDVTGGIVEAPQAVFKGIVDAGNEMINIADKIGYNLVKAITPKSLEGKLPDPKTNQGLVKGLVKDVGAYPTLETNTGEFISKVSQFTTGMAVLPAAKAVKGAKAVKTAFKFAKPAMADMIAFSQEEDRLADMLNEAVPDGSLAKGVTEWMAGDEDDSLLEGKLKQGLEGIMIDGGIEMLGKGIKTLRHAKKAVKTTKKTVPTAEQALQAGPEKSAFNTLGDIDSPELIIRKKLQTAAGEAKVPTGKEADEIVINFTKIDSPESVTEAMQQYANANAKSIKKATRGVITDKKAIKEADAGQAFTDLLTRRSGQPLNKEQTVGARMFYSATTKKLMETAELAAKNPADTAAQYNFRKMLTVHHATQKELLGARAEAGRALQAWNVNVGVPKEMQHQIDSLVGQQGGNKVSAELAQSLLQVRDDPMKMATVINGGWKTRTLDAVLELRTFGLLTSGRTHMRNTVSNTAMSFTSVGERFIASATNPNAVSRKEAYIYARSMANALGDGWKAAKDGFKTGTATRKAETGFVRKSSADVLDPNSKLPQFFRSGLDGYSSGIAKLSVDALSAMDGFFNTILFSAEKGALLTRRGLTNGLSGKELDDFIAVGMTQADDAIEASAREFALVNTFNNSLTGWEKNLQQMIGHNRGMRFIVPFVRTPINVFNMGLKATPLAPLYKSYRDDIAAGGARAALAKAKVSLGTGTLWTASSLSSDGYITGAGPQDKSIRQAWQRKGWKPYSLKVGDKYYSYQGMEPVSTLLGLASTMTEGILGYDMYGMDEDAQQSVGELMANIPLALSQEIFNKSYLTGFSDLMQVLDPAFSGDVSAQMERVGRSMATSFMPNIGKDARRAWDEKRRYVVDLADAFKDSALGLSKDLPAKRDMWGDELKYRPGNEIPDRMMQFVNPFTISAVNENPIDDEIIRLNASITSPTYKQNFTRGGYSAKIDLKEMPTVYSRFLELSGNGLKLDEFGGMGLKDYLNTLVTGKADESDDYQELPDEFKEKFLKSIVGVYRDLSKEQVYQEFPQLRNKINKGVQKNFNEIQEMTQ